MSETRKLAAILVADVVGYSRLAGADEDARFRLRARAAISSIRPSPRITGASSSAPATAASSDAGAPFPIFGISCHH